MALPENYFQYTTPNGEQRIMLRDYEGKLRIMMFDDYSGYLIEWARHRTTVQMYQELAGQLVAQGNIYAHQGEYLKWEREVERPEPNLTEEALMKIRHLYQPIINDPGGLIGPTGF